MAGCTSKPSEHSTHDEIDTVEAQSSVTQNHERDFIVDAQKNMWQRMDRFQITLPALCYIRHATIYSEDSLKIGEIALDHEPLKSPMTMHQLFSAIQHYSVIETTETNYGYAFPMKPEEVEKRLVLDSTSTHPIKWYYSIAEIEWESESDWGLWNVFSFETIQEDKITVINFYNKDRSDLSIDQYLPILNSIRFIKQ